jgi:hypothetical protein
MVILFGFRKESGMESPLEIRRTMYNFDEETLKKLQTSPVDEFGIKHVNIMYNQQEDRFYCLLDAPDKQPVENHHNKHGVKCEWITEVKTTA